MNTPASGTTGVRYWAGELKDKPLGRYTSEMHGSAHIVPPLRGIASRRASDGILGSIDFLRRVFIPSDRIGLNPDHRRFSMTSFRQTKRVRASLSRPSSLVSGNSRLTRLQ